MIAQTLGTKGINTTANIVLAWLLAREDFGLIGLAYTVTAFVSVLQRAGLREILIHRHAQFRRWANPVFWMSLTLGIGGMLLTLASIPLVVRIYQEPKLAGLLAILSLNAPLSALLVVPQAKLSNQLRFKAQSLIVVTVALVQAMIACTLAWRGWGAYSIAVAMVTSIAVNALIQWSLAPHRPGIRLRIRRWWYLMGDSAALTIMSALWTVTSQGDFIMLGIFHDAVQTGLYYFAFNLSMQTVTLFTDNLGNVLFPTLSKLQEDPHRQTQAFILASRMLALVTIPACFLQAALADPAIRLIFPDKWAPAIPVVQILCIGMAFRAVGAPGQSLMQSQGRFKTLMIFHGALSATFIISVGMAAAFGGLVAVALAESLVFVVLWPVVCYLGIRYGGGRWREVSRIYTPAMIGSVLAITPGWAAAMMLPSMPYGNVVRISLICASSLLFYWLIMPRLAPADWNGLWERFHQMLKRTSSPIAASVSVNRGN
jgi:PST family polysaccharide transporter